VSGTSEFPDPVPAPAARTGNYQEDAIYQDGKIVARAVGAQVRRDGREISFAEINSSDNLILPEECEFRSYRLMIQRIGYASRLDKNAPDKGRVLREVTAEILGARELLSS